jgi:3-phenylpropionate/trans-cinnamate dioxygenase ferredoxin reductase component
VSRADLVVIGGGPAGLAAARGYRDSGGRGDVVILAREPRPPYRRPPLTKDYLRGEIEAGELPLEQPEWFTEREVALATGVAAVALDTEARVVHTDRGDEIFYDHCVLATGSNPKRPDLPGADDLAVLTVRTVENSDALRELEPGDQAIVVGSGFIGCEAAVSLAMRGLEVELVTDEEQPQSARLGNEVGALLAGWLREAGVSFRPGRPVDAIEPGGRGVTLEGGARLQASTVVLALGVEPDIAVGADAGLEVDRGRLCCDESARTSADGVLAAGDAARLFNPLAGRHLSVEHWGEALAQGELAGRTAAGTEDRWDAVPGFWSTIGRRTIKQAAWGDGHDEVLLDERGDGWTAWYGHEGRCVGVLSHEHDDDYERGSELVAAGAPLPR